jgi:hypothetical protein
LALRVFEAFSPPTLITIAKRQMNDRPIKQGACLGLRIVSAICAERTSRIKKYA